MLQKFKQDLSEQFEPERRSVGWLWRLIFIPASILLFTVLIYAGLTFGYGPYLDSRIQEVEDEISQLATSVPKEDQEQFVRFYSQLINLESILKNHILVSKFFPFLEQITHQKVYYASASLKVPERSVKLTGFADNLTVLSEQLEIFSQSEEVDLYTLEGGIEESKDLISFRVTLNLRKDLLK